RIGAKNTGTEESPTDLQLDKEELQEVTAGKTYTISGTNSKVTMPSDLPVGSKVKVVTKNVEDTNYGGITPSGDQLIFTLEYPDGSTTPSDDVILVLGYDADADTDGLAIYYYNEETDE